jgi:hypothetical protein
MTDEGRWRSGLGKALASHEVVTTGMRPGHISTNTVEGPRSIFKRGMKGVYQHCAKKRLHRYPAELVPVQPAHRRRRK